MRAVLASYPGVSHHPAERLTCVLPWGKPPNSIHPTDHCATMATAILDRRMHRWAMLDFEGKSYRLKEATGRIAINPESS